jgi:hypothetical protein
MKQLISSCKLFPELWLLTQLDKKIPDPVEHQSLLTCSYMPNAGVYPEPAESITSYSFKTAALSEHCNKIVEFPSCKENLWEPRKELGCALSCVGRIGISFQPL